MVGAIFFSSLDHHPNPHTFTYAATSGLCYLTASCALATIGTLFLRAGHGPKISRQSRQSTGKTVTRG